MNKSTPLDLSITQLVEYLLSEQMKDKIAPATVVAAIARSPAAQADLAAISTAVTGTPSTLIEAIQARPNDATLLEGLGAYIEAEQRGDDAPRLYPQVAARIQQSPAFRAEYEALRLLVQEEAKDILAVMSPAPTFAEWYQTQTQSTPAPNATAAAEAIPVGATLWQQISATVQRLVVEIPVQIGQARTAFGTISDLLTPQLEPALAYRSRPVADNDAELDQVLNLPIADANLLIRLRTGMVTRARGMIVVEIVELAAAAPLAQVKVTLRDGEGGLLESTATDEQGLAIFRDLIADRYQLHVEQHGRRWEAPLILQ